MAYPTHHTAVMVKGSLLKLDKTYISVAICSPASDNAVTQNAEFSN
jgi:hypothetical protein